VPELKLSAKYLPLTHLTPLSAVSAYLGVRQTGATSRTPKCRGGSVARWTSVYGSASALYVEESDCLIFEGRGSAPSIERHGGTNLPTFISGPRTSTSMWRYDKKVPLLDVPEMNVGRLVPWAKVAPAFIGRSSHLTRQRHTIVCLRPRDMRLVHPWTARGCAS
jgi:hypothetical protein